MDWTAAVLARDNVQTGRPAYSKRCAPTDRTGTLVKKLQQTLPDDLAFFDDADEFVHAGISLGTRKIIHTTSKRTL